MRTTKRQVAGFLFGFVYGDINGANGLVIPTEYQPTDVDSHDFMMALLEAHDMARSFYAICWLLEESQILDVKTADIDLLASTLESVQTVLNYQSWGELDDFGSDTEGNLTGLAERIGAEMHRRSTKPQRRISAIKDRNGFVYLIQSPTGAYKIGRTNNPDDRMRTFSVKLPFEVEYVCLIHTEDMHGLEKSLHYQFEEKRINGEWFNLSPEDVEYIKRLAT